MSYSRVEHPRTSKVQRGRGRQEGASYSPRPINQPRQQPHAYGEEEEEEEEEEFDHGPTRTGNELSSVTSERTLQSRGGHYVMAPIPARNKKLKQTASEEQSVYQRHREAKREQLAEELSQQTPMAVGGQCHSRAELQDLRRQQEREQQMKARFAGIQRKQKREEYERAKRERENEEIERKKQIQREKAVKLAAKQKVEKQADLEDLRRKRLARFEKQSPP